MRNLYVVAIGGSGERVMRSLIMMLTSGVKVNAECVIPVFIENDVESHALNSCLNLLAYYKSSEGTGLGVHTIYKRLGDQRETWPTFCRTEIGDPILLNSAGDSIGTLQNVIGLTYDDKDATLTSIAEERDLLFTLDDLNMPLSVGFVGNPNIGSVVLNSKSLGTKAFDDLRTHFSADDGVIVVGSLFGGTGAAGIPLVINSINRMDANQRPTLGVVALLPYFVTNQSNHKKIHIIDTTKYDVQSDAFDAKTRAALMYYADYMTDVDFMYYVGDSKAKDVYTHCVGGKDQDNRAHLVEVMSALSVIDFAKSRKNRRTTYKRPIWGINDDRDAQRLPTNVSGIKNRDLARALVKFRMMIQLFKDGAFLQTSITQKHSYAHNIGFSEPMRQQVVDEKLAANNVNSWGLNKLIAEWVKWMDELGSEDANRKFRIYNNNEEATDNDITSKFYSETGFGVAKTRIAKTGLLGILGDKVEVAVDAEVQEALAEAYNALHPKGNKSDALTITDEQRLPLLLQIISKALDQVIDERCIDTLKA